jgi:hypothetical protein
VSEILQKKKKIPLVFFFLMLAMMTMTVLIASGGFGSMYGASSSNQILPSSCIVPFGLPYSIRQDKNDIPIGCIYCVEKVGTDETFSKKTDLALLLAIHFPSTNCTAHCISFLLWLLFYQEAKRGVCVSWYHGRRALVVWSNSNKNGEGRKRQDEQG